MNRRFDADFETEGPGYAIIDGKQRVSTIVGFANDEFAVPAEWFPGERVVESKDGMVTFSGLSPAGRRFFQNGNISCSETRVPTVEAEREIFDLINFGGVPQGESD